VPAGAGAATAGADVAAAGAGVVGVFDGAETALAGGLDAGGDDTGLDFGEQPTATSAAASDAKTADLMMRTPFEE